LHATALEIVLGIDNIIFISILVGRLPPEHARQGAPAGPGLCHGCRAWLLLFSLSWIMGLKTDLFHVLGQGISGRDLVLLFGGIFLLWKASHEIFVEVEATRRRPGHPRPRTDAAALKPRAAGVLGHHCPDRRDRHRVFARLGHHRRGHGGPAVGVMVAAVIASVGVMLFAAKPIGDFVDAHPSVKVLALAFLVMVGMALTAEAFEVHVPKGYIYAAMSFSLVVEALNIRARAKRRALQQAGHAPH
jgi:predicted tellurium resistance membrane protein TerC